MANWKQKDDFKWMVTRLLSGGKVAPKGKVLMKVKIGNYQPVEMMVRTNSSMSVYENMATAIRNGVYQEFNDRMTELQPKLNWWQRLSYRAYIRLNDKYQDEIRKEVTFLSHILNFRISVLEFLFWFDYDDQYKGLKNQLA